MVPDIETTRIDLTTIVRALRLLNRSWAVAREWAADFPESRCVPEALDRILAILDAEQTSRHSAEGDGSDSK
jgi:hypothetical protein